MVANSNQERMQKYVRLYGDGLKKELSFFSMCKQAMNSKWNENEKDPKIKFFRECMKDNTVALPIMSKIFDHMLLIKNTRLNTGLVNAICGQLLL